MITLTKALMGVGALGTTGLAAWGAWYVSTPKTIQDKLSREGLKILNLNEDDAIWRQKISEHKQINVAADQTNLKIVDLDLSTTPNQEAEDIRKFKDKCSKLLLTSLGDTGIDLKEKQAKKWCIKA